MHTNNTNWVSEWDKMVEIDYFKVPSAIQDKTWNEMMHKMHDVLLYLSTVQKHQYQLANKWEIILLLLRNLAVVKLKFGQNLMQK